MSSHQEFLKKLEKNWNFFLTVWLIAIVSNRVIPAHWVAVRIEGSKHLRMLYIFMSFYCFWHFGTSRLGVDSSKEQHSSVQYLAHPPFYVLLADHLQSVACSPDLVGKCNTCGPTKQSLKEFEDSVCINRWHCKFLSLTEQAVICGMSVKHVDITYFQLAFLTVINIQPVSWVSFGGEMLFL